jgi:hypothetical protein
VANSTYEKLANTITTTNKIKFCKHGTQVCMFEYETLPTIGKLFWVDQQHNLFEVAFTPGEVYQADSNGILQTIGLFHQQQ